MHESRIGIRAEEALHPEVPLVDLLALPRLQIARDASVPGRTRNDDQRNIDDRTDLEQQALGQQSFVDGLMNLVSPLVFSQRMDDAMKGRLTRRDARPRHPAPQPHEPREEGYVHTLPANETTLNVGHDPCQEMAGMIGPCPRRGRLRPSRRQSRVSLGKPNTRRSRTRVAGRWPESIITDCSNPSPIGPWAKQSIPGQRMNPPL